MSGTVPGKILVTRPDDEAAPLAALLAGKGYAPLVAPLLEIQPRPGLTLTVAGVQALLATSANAVRALAALGPVPGDIPLLAVGRATAAAARKAGFATVHDADGDAAALAAQARTLFDPKKGPLIHVSGAVVARDLGDLLAPDGFTVERFIAYDAEAADTLPAEARIALLAGEVSAVLFFSARTAETFADLIAADPAHLPLSAALAKVSAVCLSAQVAAAAELHGGRWKTIAVAGHPTQEALLDRLADLLPAAVEAEAAPEPAPTAPAPAPAPVAPAPRRPSAAPVALLMSLLVVGGTLGGLYVSRDQWLPALGVARQDGGEQARLQAYVARLETRLAEQDQARQGLRLRAEELDKAQAALAQRLARLEAAGTLASPAPTPTPAAAPPPPPPPVMVPVVPPELTAKIGEVAAATLALQNRVTGVESQVTDRRDADLRRAGLALAVVQLHHAARTGGKFAEPLAVVAALGGDDPDTRALADRLTPMAGGLPTPEALRRAYPAAMRAARAAAVKEAYPGWSGRVLAFAGDLVHVRPSDMPAPGGTPAERLARAEALLAQDGVIAAVAEIEGITGAAGAALAPWLTLAKQRRDGEVILNQLHARAVARLADLPRAGG